MLDDMGYSYEYIDILNIDSELGDKVTSLTGTTELPQLFIGGDSFVGIENIRRYIRK